MMMNIKKIGVLSFILLVLFAFSAGFTNAIICDAHMAYMIVATDYTGGTSETKDSSINTMTINEQSCTGETLTLLDAKFIGAPAGYDQNSFSVIKKYLNDAEATTGTTAPTQTFKLNTQYTAGSETSTDAFKAIFAIQISYMGGNEGVTFDCGDIGQVCGGEWTNGTEFTPENIIAAMKTAANSTPPGGEAPGGEVPPGGEESPPEEKKCADDPTACENQEDCEKEDWYWYDDKCNEEEEPECNVENIDKRCTTEEKCENAEGVYWDATAKKCKVCLAGCTSSGEDVSGDPLQRACCVNKCSPSPAKNLTSASLPKCVIENNMSVYYEYSCDGVSGNGIKKANGYCDGNATLNITSSGVKVTKILYGREYDVTIYFNKDVKKSPNPTLNLKLNDTIIENMILTNCTKDKLVSGYSQVFCSKITASEKGLNDNLNIELSAKTTADGNFMLNQNTILIDTKNLQTPKIKITRLS